jgi:hypothetical protein
MMSTPPAGSKNAWFRMNAMNRAIGVVLSIVGGVWFFQGIGVAQGSDMSNNPWWAVLGAAFFVAGFIVLYRANVTAKKLIADEEAAAAASGDGASTAPDAQEGNESDDRPDAVERDK